MTMRQIDENNAADYLVETGRLDTAVPVRALSGGVSNIVLWVDADPPFVLKQSRPQLRTVDPWFSDIARIHREVDAMRSLAPVLGQYVPQILFEDRDNYLFAMSAAPRDATTWKQVLLGGTAELHRAQLAGEVLGKLHQAGASDPQWRQTFGDATNFYELRLEPYYLRLRDRNPKLRQYVEPLIQRAQTVQLSLVHADFSPKNILVTPETWLLVDYETVHFGDPTFDLGFFLAHLTLKSIHRQQQFDDYAALIEGFWRSYLLGVSFEEPSVLVSNGLQHLAANLLVRIDGTSPVDYLTDERHRQTGRHYAHELFRQRPDTHAEALALLRSLVQRNRGEPLA